MEKAQEKTAFEDKLAHALQKYGMARHGGRVLVAFSGGADSLALLCACIAVKDALGLEVAAAHLDHGLRGAAGKADADWAESFCRDREVPFFRGYWPGSDMVKPGQSPENAARNARRRFLEETLRAWPGDVIALGHHLDDQAETVLIHLLHGAGLRGLGGMRPVSLPYIRPMLEISRSEIDAYIATQALSPRIDQTNEDPTYLRNMLRHEVIPALKQRNPAFAAATGRMASLARDEDAYLDRVAGEALAALLAAAIPDAMDAKPKQMQTLAILAGREDKDGLSLRLPIDGVLALDPVVARRVLRLWMNQSTWTNTNFDYTSINRVYTLAINGRVGAIAEAGGGICIMREKGHLYIQCTKDEAVSPEDTSPAGAAYNEPDLHTGVEVVPGKTIHLHGGKLCFTAEWAAPEPVQTLEATAQALPYAIFFYHNQPDAPLPTLRYRRPGDWLRMPYGKKKLKALLQEKGVPEAFRDTLPLLAIGSQILWVPGLANGVPAHAHAADSTVCGILMGFLIA